MKLHKAMLRKHIITAIQECRATHGHIVVDTITEHLWLALHKDAGIPIVDGEAIKEAVQLHGDGTGCADCD